MQTIIVFVIVAFVFVVIAWRMYKLFTRKEENNPLCGDCDADCEIRSIIQNKKEKKEEPEEQCDFNRKSSKTPQE